MKEIILLRKNTNSKVFTIVDKAQLGFEPFEPNEVAKVLGTMLSKIIDYLKNPVMVSTLVDATIDNWTENDIKSINFVLSQDNLKLLFVENTIDKLTSPVSYVLHSEGKLFSEPEVMGFPKAPSYNLDEVVEKLYAPLGLFSTNKFPVDVIDNLVKSMESTRTLIGTVDPYDINELSKVNEALGLELIVLNAAENITV